MLWDYTMNERKEKRELQTQYIYKNIDPEKKECIQAAVEHFGIKVKFVRNYKDAIEKLLKQKRPGFCNYYAVWIIGGPGIGILPDKSKHVNLVGQFIEVLTRFWKNGGASVFWTESDPIYSQVNEFLKKNGFKFQLEGNHKGYQTLYPSETDDLKKDVDI